MWMDAPIPSDLPSLGPLTHDTEAEVCIVGAGIAGLSVAYELSRRGVQVLLIDDGPIASGETERTTAHLSNAIDDRYFEIERLHGQRGAQLAADSHTAAIRYIESTVLREKIDCDFERLDGYLITAPEHDTDYLRRELHAARRAGVPGIELVSQIPFPLARRHEALRFPAQGQFHPLKYLRGLLAAIIRRGGRIHTHTHAADLHDGTPCSVRTDTGRTVRADALVIATNAPVNDRVKMHTKQVPYRTYAIGARLNPHSHDPSITFPHILLWDTADPYHYVRLQREAEHHSLIVGGEDHKTGQPEKPFPAHWDALITWTRQHFPITDILHRWSGQVIEPVDYIAYIGLNPGDKHTYIVTGDSGQGMTHGTVAGLLISDLITNRDNPWRELYDPARKTLRAAGEFTRHNVNVAGQYADYGRRADIKTVHDLLPGHGAILRRGIKKIAAYKDEHGAVHQHSAVCPHLGCVVHWNHAEKTWDCPCHGSRFDPLGTVLNGPANTNLKPIAETPAPPPEHDHEPVAP